VVPLCGIKIPEHQIRLSLSCISLRLLLQLSLLLLSLDSIQQITLKKVPSILSFSSLPINYLEFILIILEVSTYINYFSCFIITKDDSKYIDLYLLCCTIKER